MPESVAIDIPSGKVPTGKPPSSNYISSKREKTGLQTKVTLQVRLVSGHDLMIQDKKTASSDPYVVLTLGSQKRRSKVIQQCLEPVWEEDFTFKTSDAFAEKLKLSVYDRDRGIGNLDDFMGKAELDLGPLRDADEHAFSEVKLSTQGHLVLRVSKIAEKTFHSTSVGSAATSAADWAANKASHVVTGVKDVAVNLGESANDDMALAAKGVGKVGSAAMHTARMPGEYLAKKTDQMTAALLERVLTSVSDIVKESLKDPEMPSCLKQTIDRTYSVVWNGISEQIHDNVHASMRLENAKYNAMLSRYRAGAPSFWPRGAKRPQPYTYLRAKVLYTLLPSDGTMWSTARDPVAWCIRLAMVMPIVSVCMMVFLFVCIRKRDEFQLINYITMTRALQAVAVGVVGIITAGIKFYGCLKELDHSLASLFIALGIDDSTSVIEGDGVTAPADSIFAIRDSCTALNVAPGYDPISIGTFIVEPFRHLCVYLCYYLLLTGYSRGGEEHLHALERVRLDAADGRIDGGLDHSRASKVQQSLLDGDEETTAEPVSEAALWEAGEKEREKLPPRYGLHIKYFIAWDVSVFSFLALGMAHGLYNDHHVWMRFTDIFYMNLIYSVMMMPFILLVLPFVSTAITDAVPTAYDKSGHLGGMLTPPMMDRKRKYEAKMKRKAARRSTSDKDDDDDDDDDDKSVKMGGALKLFRTLF